MPITQQDYSTLEQVRTNLLDNMKGVSDEFVLATYNRLTRTLDRRLPQIETRLKQAEKKAETKAAAGVGKESVKQAAAAMRAARANGQNGSFGGASPQPSATSSSSS